MLVKVPPFHLKGRTWDEMPAEVVLDLDSELKNAGIDGTADAASMQVIEYDKRTGQPIAYGGFAYGKSDYDRPVRWYDGAIPYDFPEFEAYLNSSGGRLTRWATHPRWGYFYGCTGDWKKGHLAWTHTQRGGEASYYGIYFDLLEDGREPQEAEPRGFIGDGMNRCLEGPASNTGLIHARIDVDDWNGDGLPDLIAGNGRGTIVWYPNLGTAREPKFSCSKMLFTTDGKPIDLGWAAAPRSVDWDSDGVKDIVAGAEANRIAWFKNEGLVNDDSGDFLALPISPCPEGLGPDGSQVFQKDYYPVPEVVDWDGDGTADLLAGGYITGRVFFYRNSGRDSDGAPILSFQGPVEADGVPIDVEWCAAPCAYDFDHDGDLDLVVGKLQKTSIADSNRFLTYYENVGSRTDPVLREKRFPAEGRFPNPYLSTPRAADVNADALIDLVVSAGSHVYLFLNQGAQTKPRFGAHCDPLILGKWGNDNPHAYQFIDWNKDGLADAVSGWSTGINTGRGSPGIFEAYTSIVPANQPIELHQTDQGDGWQFRRLFDLDGDGSIDCMNADHGGRIWFNRNLGSNDKPRFERHGVMLALADGAPIKVGPKPDQAWDFNVLQGARATYTVADFTGDGKNDLVIGDTYGVVRFYENIGKQGGPVFAPPIEVGNQGIRLVPSFTDYNKDGKLDIIAAAYVDWFEVYIKTGEEGGNRFAAGERVHLPGGPYGAGEPICVTDYNSDGDDDIVCSSAYGYYLWTEKSFLEHGYARAEFVESLRKRR